MIKSLGKKIGNLADDEEKLSKNYKDYTSALNDYLRKMKEKHKQMENLSQEAKSGIPAAEVKEFKKQVDTLTDKIKMVTGYYQAMEDLARQKKAMIKKMDEYSSIIVEGAKLRKAKVDIGLKIEKAKDKLDDVDSITKFEENLKSAERELDRTKKEIENRWKLLVQEQGEVNQKWAAFRDSIDNFE
jgi:DNA repair exonuclease SbcCD ATPase subunit